jgi:hypothetical protein
MDMILSRCFPQSTIQSQISTLKSYSGPTGKLGNVRQDLVQVQLMVLNQMHTFKKAEEKPNLFYQGAGYKV